MGGGGRDIIPELQAINTTWGEARRKPKTGRGGKKLWLLYDPHGMKWNKSSKSSYQRGKDGIVITTN